MKRLIKAQAGFTLIEVIIVVLLLGITAAMVLPRGLGSAPNHAALDSQAQQLAGLLRLARANAMAEGTDYKVIIDTGKCRIEPVSAADITAADAAQMSVDDRISIIPQPPLGKNIVFNPRGVPAGGGGTIKMQTKGGEPDEESVVINELGIVEIR